MNKTKIVIGISTVFIALIIMAFLPALKSSNEGYNTKTVAVKPAQEADVANTVVEVPEAATATDEAVAEEKVAAVTTPQDSNEEKVAPEESAVNEAKVEPSTKATTSAAETTASNKPIEPATETETSTDESTLVEAATSSEPEKPATKTETPKDQPIASATEAAAPADKTAVSTATEGLYSVVDGNKLDAHSYAGFKLFRNWCARCHGTYGQGMVGPDLAESLKVISKEQFYDTVENGKSGTIGSMPPWKANVQVMENRDQLYAYLKARSDGAIGVVKPLQQK